MLKEMKKALVDSITEAKESGELTAHQVYDITRNGIAESIQDLKDGAKDLREITKEAVMSSVQTLVDAGEATEDKISAALHGVLDGVKQVESQMVETVNKEYNHVKQKLREKEEKLADRLLYSFEGVIDATGNFTGEVKADLETALKDAKLKSTELLGLTRDTVKQAVRNAIETGDDVEDIIVKITRDATSKALAEVRFSAGRTRRVSEAVLSAAVEAAEEVGSHVSETASAAAEGVRQGVGDAVDYTRESITSAGKGLKADALGELEQTKEDLESIGDLFVETLRKVADKSGNVAKNTLHDLADDARKAGSNLREKALSASHTVAENIKELGSDALQKTEEVGGKAAHALTDEAMELGERMLAVAKGAATGFWEGAKTAFNKDDDKKES